MQFVFDNMGSYDVGSKFKNVPVLKFMDYDRVVVLLDGRPEEATIEGTSNNYGGGDIYHITAPSGTVADIEVVGIDAYEKNRRIARPEIYSLYNMPDLISSNRSSNHSDKRLIAKNIHIQ